MTSAPSLPMIDPEITLHLKLPERGIRQLFPLFHSGIGIKTLAGISLMGLLHGQLGIDEDIIRDSVQTVFINGRAVDHAEKVKIPPDAVVALSAAMPGLVGATLRSGGLLAGLRQGISYPEEGNVPDELKNETLIQLKLFNLAAENLAPQILPRGILVKGETLRDLLNHSQLSGYLEQKGAMEWNGRQMSMDDLDHLIPPEGWVALTASP